MLTLYNKELFCVIADLISFSCLSVFLSLYLFVSNCLYFSVCLIVFLSYYFLFLTYISYMNLVFLKVTTWQPRTLGRRPEVQKI